MSSCGSEANSIASSEFTDDDIPYYKSFDGSLMDVPSLEHGKQNVSELHNAAERTKGMIFKTKERLIRCSK